MTSSHYLLFKGAILRFGVVLRILRVDQLPAQLLDFHLQLLALELARLATFGPGRLLFRLLPVLALVLQLRFQRLPDPSLFPQPSFDRLHALPFLLPLGRQVLESEMDHILKFFGMDEFIIG